MATSPLSHENVWVQKPQYDKAERLHYERLAKADSWTLPNSNPSANLSCQKSNKKNKTIPAPSDEPIANNADDSCHANAKKFKPKEAKEKKNKAYKQHEDESDMKSINVQSNVEDYLPRTVQGGPEYSCSIVCAPGSLASEVAKARQHIKESLKCVDSIAALSGGSSPEIVSRVSALEKENTDLKNIVAELKSVLTEVKIVVGRLDQRVNVLESSRLSPGDPGYIAVCPAKPSSQTQQPAKAAAKNDDDDDVDLFGSDSEGEDDEAAKIREERLAAYAAKKSNKPVLIAKSNIILDVKPWDDETDMKQMEVEVRKVETDGLLWGAAKLVPLAYGIHKLQISCVVEDDKVSVDWLTEQLEAIEDFVQSVDIAAFNKV